MENSNLCCNIELRKNKLTSLCPNKKHKHKGKIILNTDKLMEIRETLCWVLWRGKHFLYSKLHRPHVKSNKNEKTWDYETTNISRTSPKIIKNTET